MKKVLALLAACAAVGVVHAESQLGFGQSSNIRASATLQMRVIVPKLILLRVGSPGSTQDSMNWSVGATIQSTPTSTPDPASATNNLVLNWDGTGSTYMPTFNVAGANTTMKVWAFTNASGASVSCVVPTWTNSPSFTNAQFTVTSSAGLAHPGANLGACGANTPLTAGAVQTGEWTYNLDATATQIASWVPGTYTAQVTYTATAP